MTASRASVPKPPGRVSENTKMIITVIVGMVAFEWIILGAFVLAAKMP